MTTPADILDFWFAPSSRPMWFVRDQGFDREVREVLLAPYQQVAAGAFAAWRDTPEGCLALVLLFDQAPRTLFRGGPEAFAGDGPALELAHRIIDHAYDLGFRADRRLFAYLPFGHSESPGDQQLSVFLIRTRIGHPELVAQAERHRHIIDRFGRFPERNAALGRDCTAAEQAFLDENPVILGLVPR